MPTLQVKRLKALLTECGITPSSRVVPLRVPGHRGELNGLASSHFVTSAEQFDKLWNAWHNRQDRQEGQECWALASTNNRTGIVSKRGRIVL